MRLAIVGPPLSGKTTLFSALTGLEAAQSTSREGGVHLGQFTVPDPRLERLAAVIPHPVVKGVSVEIADIPGLGTEMGSERGVSETALGPARTADALLIVVRAFGRPSVPHPAGRVDPVTDLQAVWNDLLTADLLSVEKRLEKLRSLIGKGGADREETAEAEILERIVPALEEGDGVGTVGLSDSEERLVRGFGFLSAKPLLVIVNLGEEHLPPRVEDQWREWGEVRGAETMALCADLLLEIGRLEPGEAREFAAAYGVNPERAVAVIEAAYRALEVVTFYTATGGRELRAWTLRSGRSAVEAAGTIHSDMERGFIRAEVVGIEDLVAAGGWSEARKAGLVRQEGKSYRVADGDVLNIKFAV